MCKVRPVLPRCAASFPLFYCVAIAQVWGAVFLCTATTAADGRPEREPDSERQATGAADAACGGRRAPRRRHPPVGSRTNDKTHDTEKTYTISPL
eukprot:scaffold20725_cov111-Isochrysis_galbana.AAC.20